jgi:hypothetical protein
MAAHLDEEQSIRTLLAPFERLEPATLGGRRSRRCRTAYVAAALAVVACAGVAVADSVNPLAGIGAANHARTPADVLDQSAQDQVRSAKAPNGFDPIGGQLTGAARLVGTVPSGRRIYVVPTTKGRVCVLVEGLAESCGDPLTQDQPITFTASWVGPGEPNYAWGVARDGVKSVSFDVSPTQRVTVPVEHNVFVYEGKPSESATGFANTAVTFDDGHVQPIG